MGGEHGTVKLEGGEVTGAETGDCVMFFAGPGQTRLGEKEPSNQAWVQYGHKVEEGSAQTANMPGGATKVAWTANEVKLKKGEWIEFEIEVTPPPWDLLDGITNGGDRSIVVGAWTGTENCAP